MKPIVLCLILSVFILLSFACGGAVQNSVQTGGDSPTDAYKKLFAAVKSKNTEAIKGVLSKKSIELARFGGERNKKPEASWFENGMTATTFADTLPTMRDERINGDMGALEVWNTRDSKWDDLPFIKEDGSWKLAFGDVWQDTWHSPGKGRDQLEREAANAVSNTQIPSIDTNKIPITNAGPMPKVPGNSK